MMQDPHDPETERLVNIRLGEALHQARRGALGVPSSVETLRTMLARAGIGLVLTIPEKR